VPVILAADALELVTRNDSIIRSITGKEILRAMHPYLGMLVGNMDAQIAQAMGGTGYNPRGVVVDAVGKIDPAGLAGIKGILSNHVLSVILSVDGKQIGQMSDLNNYVDSKAVGDNVVLTVFVKGGNPPVQNINVKLGERPAPFSSYSAQAGAVNTLSGSANGTCGGGHSLLGGASNGGGC
jgi:S1-C subfamily serine protease